jgi:hypothetical protein
MVILGKLNDAKVGENHIITGNDYPTWHILLHIFYSLANDASLIFNYLVKSIPLPLYYTIPMSCITLQSPPTHTKLRIPDIFCSSITISYPNNILIQSDSFYELLSPLFFF